MSGMSRTTGETLDGIAHLKQSIVDILTTPIGSRVMRRDYGSRLFELIDAPLNRVTLMSIYAETADAIAKWEPRYALQSVTADEAEQGHVSLTLTGTYRINGQTVELDGVRIS